MPKKILVVGNILRLGIRAHGSNTFNTPKIPVIGPQAFVRTSSAAQIAPQNGAIWATCRGYLGHLNILPYLQF